MIVGITSPGAMGAAMAKRLTDQGLEVRALLAGRSTDSLARAASASMSEADEEAFVACDVILSILPPSAALEMAERLRPALSSAPRKPVYVDCNAVSPESVAEIAAVVEATGTAFVDGSIIGLPPNATRRGATLFVSGPHAAEIEPLTAFGIPVRVLDAPVGGASALKMSYAGITKGTFAIGSAMILAAMRAGAAPALRDELEVTHPGLFAFLARGIGDMHEKTYRWVAEMREIADFLGADRAEYGIYHAVARHYEQLTADFAGGRGKATQLDRFFDSSPAYGVDASVRLLAAREQELYDAMICEDFAALDDILADDSTYAHSTGVVETKAAYLLSIREGLYEYESIETRGATLRIMGRMASATATVLMSVGERGQPKNQVLLLSTLVWILDSGKWRLWRRHATRIPASAQNAFSLKETETFTE